MLTLAFINFPLNIFYSPVILWSIYICVNVHNIIVRRMPPEISSDAYLSITPLQLTSLVNFHQVSFPAQKIFWKFIGGHCGTPRINSDCLSIRLSFLNQNPLPINHSHLMQLYCYFSVSINIVNNQLWQRWDDFTNCDNCNQYGHIKCLLQYDHSC